MVKKWSLWVPKQYTVHCLWKNSQKLWLLFMNSSRNSAWNFWNAWKKKKKKRVKHKRRRRISASKPTLYICTYQHIFVGCNNMLVIWLNSRTKNEKKKKKNRYFFARKSCVCAKWCVINTSILEIVVDHYHQSLSYVAIEIYFAIPAWSHLCSYFYIPIIQVSILIFWVGGEC